MDFTSAISHSSSRPLQIEIYIPPASSKRSSLGHQEPVIDLSSFSDDGFHDFTLDLGCMSPPPSPPGSLLARTITRSDSTHGPGGGLGLGIPALPSPPSPRPLSFLQDNSSMTTSQLQEHSREQQRRTSQVLPSPKLSAITSASALQSSWPLTGRGTPVDHSRRSEWGSLSADHHHTTAGIITNRGEGAGVGEDGVLFSTSTTTITGGGGGGVGSSSSLDSAIRPSQCHSINMTGVGAGSSAWLTNLRQLERSASRILQRSPHSELLDDSDIGMGEEIETEDIPPVPLLSSDTMTTREQTTTTSLPEDSRIKLQVDSDPAEWDSLMQTVLGSTGASSSSASSSETRQEVPPNPLQPTIIQTTERNHEDGSTQLVDDNSPEAAAAISEIDQAFRIGIGLDDIAQFRVPDPSSGTRAGGGGGTQTECDDSPSAYSTPPATPRESQSQINVDDHDVDIVIVGHGDHAGEGVKHAQSVRSLSSRRSPQSTVHNNQNHHHSGPAGWKDDRVPLRGEHHKEPAAGSVAWWKRFLSSLQRMQKSLRHPTTTSHHRRRF